MQDQTAAFRACAGLEAEGDVSPRRAPAVRTTTTEAEQNAGSAEKRLHSALHRVEMELQASLRQVHALLEDKGLLYSRIAETLYGRVLLPEDEGALETRIKAVLGQVDGTLAALAARLQSCQGALPPSVVTHHTQGMQGLMRSALGLSKRFQELQDDRQRQRLLHKAVAENRFALLEGILPCAQQPTATLRRRARPPLPPTGSSNPERRSAVLLAPQQSSDGDHSVGLTEQPLDSHGQSTDADSATTSSPTRLLGEGPVVQGKASGAPPARKRNPNLHAAVSTAEQESEPGVLDGMSAEAERSLRQSHRQLLVDLTDLHQDVERAESTMYDLAQLQARLAQTLQEQDHVIEQIQANADTAQHNVDSGNEELTAAMKYQRDFRWGVLFFFLILSLTLLALDALKGR